MARPIRSVVFLTYHYPPEIGGIQTRISKYVEKLGARGIKVTVILAGRHGTAGGRWGAARVIVCRGGLARFPRDMDSIMSAILESRADVVHVFTGASTLLGSGTLFVGGLVKARSVISLFGREDLDLPHLVSRVTLRISARLAYAIDVNSGATRALLPKRLRWKTRVLLGGAEEPSRIPGPPDGDAPLLLYVGRLAARKGIDDLLRAFSMVKLTHPEVKLTVVGDGPEKEHLISFASELGISGSVQFTGTLRGPELEREYDNCYAVVLPSKDVPGDTANEGLGLTLVEGAMRGKPLIGTRHGGIPEVVKDGVNGLLVPPSDPKALANAILKLLEERSLAEHMGEESYRLAKANFTWDRATETLLESYNWRDIGTLIRQD